MSESIIDNLQQIDEILRETGSRVTDLRPEFQRVILMAARINQASAITGKSTWDDIYMLNAAVWACKSKDKHTKLGATIYGPNHEPVSSGYNSFPRGLNDNVPERYERPAKYLWTAHAEVNALANAPRGIKGCTMCVSLMPCVSAGCAPAIVNSGIISRVIIDKASHDAWYSEKYASDERTTIQMFMECGIELWWWSPGETWPHDRFQYLAD